MLGDQRPADRRHQRVAIHVESVGQDGRQAVTLGEFVAGVDDDGFDGAAVQRPLTHDLHVLTALPRSIATATTSRPVSLPIQLIATEVSKPPEYAKMTRSDMS